MRQNKKSISNADLSSLKLNILIKLNTIRQIIHRPPSVINCYYSILNTSAVLLDGLQDPENGDRCCHTHTHAHTHAGFNVA